MIKAAVRARTARVCHSVFKKICRVSEPGFKMRLTQKCGLVTILLKVMRNRGLMFWERYTVHPDTVGGNVLACDDCRARWHTNDILIVSARVVYPRRCQLIDIGRSRNLTAVAAQGIKSHLIRGDQENVSRIRFHRSTSFKLQRFLSWVEHHYYSLGADTRVGLNPLKICEIRLGVPFFVVKLFALRLLSR